MGFVCPECNRDFGTDEKSLIKHMKDHKGSVWNDFIIESKKSRKKTSVNMIALEKAIEDGRIAFGITIDGEGFLQNKRTGKRISLGYAGVYEGAE